MPNKHSLRGLKFTPTLKSNSIQLTCSLKAFAHKLRLAEYFDDHNIMPVDHKNKSSESKSNFYPPKYRSKELETNISFINNIDITSRKSYQTNNFSPKEWTDLKI